MLLKRVATCAHHVEAQCKKIYDKIANSSICLERTVRSEVDLL